MKFVIHQKIPLFVASAPTCFLHSFCVEIVNAHENDSKFNSNFKDEKNNGQAHFGNIPTVLQNFTALLLLTKSLQMTSKLLKNRPILLDSPSKALINDQNKMEIRKKSIFFQDFSPYFVREC